MDFKQIKEREKEQRRDIIIDAAETLFFSRSYDDVSIEDIASQIGLSKTGIYRYFESKEAIIYAIILRGTKIVHQMLFDALERASDELEKVLLYPDVTDEFARQYPNYMKVCNLMLSGRFNSENLMSNPDCQESSRLMIEMFMTYFNSIQKGMEDGSIRSDINPIEMAVFMSIISEGMANLRPDQLMILTNGGISRDIFSQNVKRLVRGMIASPSSVIQEEGDPGEEK